MSFDPARWNRLNDLFHQAEDLASNEVAGFLDRECSDDLELRRELEAMLSTSDDISSEAMDAVQRSMLNAMGEGRVSLVDTKIGAYRLSRELGRGGMGVVYLGVRADGDFDHQAAIKVLPAALLDGQARWRFQTERQILASLQHPGIARLIDGGETKDGLPYVIMDYVDGVPIDEYCRARRLSIRDRLTLFLSVCEAVAHAHSHLVVHRDLKPSNILVNDEGQPTLLDFGIAKLLDDPAQASLTRQGFRALTPRYASPEQVRGEPVGTVSDVYTLGVLLYELLTELPPLALDGQTASEFERQLLTQVPRPPSQAAQRPALQGDLDTIVLKALEKDADRRYASVELLAADVQRHLAGHPVAARPPTLRYRAGKFVRRNTGGVAAAALALGLLVAFSVTVTLQAGRIAQERDVAEAERVKAAAVSEFLVDVFQANDPNNAQGVELTAGEILSRGGQRIRGSLEDQPEVRGEILKTIGVLYRGLGEFDSAGVFLEEAVGLHANRMDTDRMEYIAAQNQMALLLEARGEYEQARALFEQVLADREQLEGPDSEGVALALHELARFKQSRGETDMGPLYERAIAIHRAQPDSNHAEIVRSLTGLASLLRREGNADSAVVVMEDAVDAQKRLYGEEHLTVAAGLNSLGAVHYTRGHLDLAETAFRETLRIRVRLLGELHPRVFTAKNNLALTLSENGGLAEAESLYREIIAGGRERGDGPGTYARPLHNLGLLLNRLGRFEESTAAFEESIEARRTALGVRHPDVAFPLIGLATARRQAGDASGAEEALLEAMSIRQDAFGPTDRLVALDHYAYARFLISQDRVVEAERELDRTVEIQREVLSPGHVDLGETLTTLGKLRIQMGDAAGAREVLSEAVGILEDTQSEALGDARERLSALIPGGASL